MNVIGYSAYTFGDHSSYKELREKLKQLQNVRYCVNMAKKAMEPVQQIKDKAQVR